MVRSENLQADRQLFSALAGGLELLLRARRYALSSRVDIWQFALSGDELREAGFSTNEFRLLVHGGFVANAMEITLPGDECRTFRPIGPLSQVPGTCYVLLESGEQFADEVLNRTIPVSNELHAACANGDPTNPLISRDALNNGTAREHASNKIPFWDASRKELRLGDEIIKIFKWPACNQELVLAVFEEEGWPARIDDPLPLADGQNPKRRLHDTIKCLNRSQKQALIHFRGDGTGEGVIWELVNNGARKRKSAGRR